MKVTIHQPEHFPYLGFFSKMNEADVMVILDNVNYRKNYFQNRNRFLNKNEKDEWFTVPVEKNATKKHIKDVLVSKDTKWRKKLIRQMNMNFKLDIDLLESIYDGDYLIDINMRSIDYCRGLLGLNTNIVFASQLNVEGLKSELLANICKKLKATEYISGPSGKDYLEKEYFDDIKIRYFEPKPQNHYSTLYNIVEGIV